MFVDGDTAIVEVQSIAQSKKGHAYENEYVWIRRFNAGKAVEVRVYYDDVWGFGARRFISNRVFCQTLSSPKPLK